MNSRPAVTAAVVVAAAIANAQGHALRFTKDRQAVVVPNCPALDITGDITVEGWIKPEENVKQAIFKFIVSKNYNTKGYALLMVGQGGRERIQFEATELLAYGANEGYVEKAFRNTWIHVAGVVERGRQRLYINGLLVRENPKQAVLRSTTMPLQIGGSPWSSFHGSIDEVRIWNVARSQEQINHDKGRYLTGKEPDLVGYWTFDEGQGRIAHNKAGRTPDGVLGFGWNINPRAAGFMDSGKADVHSLPQWVEGVSLTRGKQPRVGPRRRPSAR